MVTVDTIARVRRAYFVQKRKIKAIARDLKLARNTVREIVRAEDQTEHCYVRREQPRPRLGPHVAVLEQMLGDSPSGSALPTFACSWSCGGMATPAATMPCAATRESGRSARASARRWPTYR